MNGYFLGQCKWPPSPDLEPFFFSFHITPGSIERVCAPDSLEYLKKYEPIGCRDTGTRDILIKHGVDAFYSKCITLTFPRRQSSPQHGKVYIVGVSKAARSAIPRRIRDKAVIVDQAKLRVPGLTPEIKESLCEHLLEMYRDTASLVITSKIHCAMPCIAMGVPVVFLYDSKKKNDYRVGVVKEIIGINYVDETVFGRLINRFVGKKIDWAPSPVDIESEKGSIRSNYLSAFERAVSKFAPVLN